MTDHRIPIDAGDPPTEADRPEPIRFVDGILGPMHPAIRRPTPREALYVHCKAREAKERAQRGGA